MMHKWPLDGGVFLKVRALQGDGLYSRLNPPASTGIALMRAVSSSLVR